jgi:hypothetical protein
MGHVFREREKQRLLEVRWKRGNGVVQARQLIFAIIRNGVRLCHVEARTREVFGIVEELAHSAATTPIAAFVDSDAFQPDSK